MFDFTSRRLASLLALPLMFAASSIGAQTYPCAGPGPGEIMVGMAPGGPGIAPQPICQRVADGDGYGGQQSSGYLPPVHMSVVWHPDTSKVWIAKGFPSTKAAEDEALDACTEALGEGCAVGQSWYNAATIVVVTDAVDNVFIGGGATSREASRKADDDCEKYSTGCHKSETITNSFRGPEVDFPSRRIQRRPFGAVARPKGKVEEKWDDTAWLATGKDGVKAAERAALSRCQLDTGVECFIRASAGNGLIARVVDDQGHVYWWNVPTARALSKAIDASCDKGRICRVVDTFDVRVPGDTTLQVSTSEHPLRGFFSLARPSDTEAAKAWRKRAFVSGMPTADAADQAAIAMCEKESGQKCDTGIKRGDRGTDQFMDLARMTDGTVRVFLGMSPEDARKDRDAYCTEHHEPCGEGLSVDLATKASTLLSI